MKNMVVDDWKHYRTFILNNEESGNEEYKNKIKELFGKIDQLVFENVILKNNVNLLTTKEQLTNTRIRLLEDQNSEKIVIANKVLYDILDQLIFIQISDDILKIENRKCPKCNQKLNEETYEKVKIDIDSLFNSIKKIQYDIEKEIHKY